VPARRRTDLDEAQASAVLAGIAEVDWEALYHAYGSASDVPVLLRAVTVGDDPTRAAAWWELWGNIHHQGSVYEATLPAVAPLIALATWKAYPDRVQALRMLREVAGSEDVHVWHYGADGEIVHDEHRSREVRSALLDAVQRHTDELVGSWREEVGGGAASAAVAAGRLAGARAPLPRPGRRGAPRRLRPALAWSGHRRRARGGAEGSTGRARSLDRWLECGWREAVPRLITSQRASIPAPTR
jgi:hypothetical protein